MQIKWLLIVVVSFSLASCPDFSPHVPKELAQKGLDAWLEAGGSAEPKLSFPKGQQDRAVIVKVYAHDYEKSKSYAELELKDFKYREDDEDKSHSGKAMLNLRKDDGKWSVAGLTLLDGDRVLKEFKPKEPIPID
ncbi:MAG: hypothetical protein K8T89_23505 [Planctomycetes bacterium]|nr:hypothetical protein [Planctomycetota bacterium]